MAADHVVSVIPAVPGYFALDRLVDYDNREKMTIAKMPVIGWVVHVYPTDDNNFYLEPVCTEAFSSYYDNEVLHPDGRVIAFGLQIWATYDQFESYAQHEYANALDNNKLMKVRKNRVEYA